MSPAIAAGLLWATLATGAGPVDAPDVLYQALHGDPDLVAADVLLGAPGRYVGHAVRTRGSLVRAGATSFAIVAGARRARLRLEPGAAAAVGARASSWEGRGVEVVGFFYREGLDLPESTYALRAWSVQPVTQRGGPDAEAVADALPLSLEQLVYAAGRYDGRLVRVRGIYRGSNLHNDLPETSREGPRDWVLKDGYFAVWVTGREARGEGWDLTRRSRAETDAALEVVGIPKFWGGVVRLTAREVDVSAVSSGTTTSRGLGAADSTRDPSLAPRVSFAYPVPGDTLDAQGHMIIQFSTSMDPTRFEAGVRVRYVQGERVTGTPRVRLDYRDRYRALVLTPEPPPPPGTEVVVDLLDAVIDVEGHALTAGHPGAPGETTQGGGPVDQVRFSSRP